MPHTDPYPSQILMSKSLLKFWITHWKTSSLPSCQKIKLAFIKNRQSYFNITQLFDILYSSHEDWPKCIDSIEAEKAFDRAEWSYLFAVLDKFGFGPSFTLWIKLLYSQPTAMIRTNSQMSKPFNLHRGSLQGCHLSPMLFDLAIEPLAIALYL